MQAKNLGTDIATYKAAQRIAESENLRKKFEEYTGDKLDSDTDTAITQIAVAMGRHSMRSTKKELIHSSSPMATRPRREK